MRSFQREMRLAKIQYEREQLVNYENRKVESEAISINLLARNSQEKKRFVKTYDRFSNLPEPIVHHIFSFLDAKDIVRLSTLSKTFEHLCISYPCLSFKGLYDSKECNEKCKAFSKCVNNHLVLRDGAKIERLDLQWRCKEGYLKEAVLNTWIHEAVRCQVEVLHLKLSLCLMDTKSYVLPSCIFECPSLSEFELTFRTEELTFSSENYLKLPSPSVNISSLQVLSLGLFRIEDDIDLGHWICTLCKTLKKLSLYEIQGGSNTLSFRSNSLEDLSVRLCFRADEYFVTISAAKLHTLSFDTRWPERIVTMNIGDECVRTFNFNGWPGCKFSKSFMEIDTASIGRVCATLDRKLILGTLQAVSQCRVLNIDVSILKELYLVEQQKVFFGIVQELIIEVSSLSDKLVPIIGTFLRGLPNLTTLSIKCNYSVELSRKILELDPSKESKFIKENEESQNVFFRHLKVVEIDTTDQHTGLMDYLMKHAICLEKMIVVTVKMLYPTQDDIPLLSLVRPRPNLG